MNQQFLENLQSGIVINILSRLPTPEFAKYHVSKSVPGLVVYQCEIRSNLFKIFDFEEAVEHHELHYNRITEFDRDAFFRLSNSSVGIEGSTNGLLFLRENTQPDALYICNPITREYIELPSLEGIVQYLTIVTYGLGVSKMSGEYKVVRIYHERILDPHNPSFLSSIPKIECRVYTLGTATWRSIPPDLKGSCLISCLNIETELFSSFCTPTLPDRSRFLGGIAVLGDCLCLCDNTSENEIVIWVMKEYEVETYWTKEFVISKSPDLAGEYYEVVYPLKVFRDGDILMWWEDFHLFYYCNRTKTTKKLDMFKERSWGCIEAMLHTSIFVSLKSFVNENVNSF
ncbi:hypothetical protein BUALT_Bualt08G0131100 [Buddleja alternifolia]|uniref:F-box associated beta-propeller type 3 domain-containing protein n=1 Tax=Buddleja alternifolia TaxID=168488 RepID=A0AAV6XD17_9LAMI|nr:hypothetical protein BUALT_Bualt08G0131100 [Buddleja alternifolia]